MLVVHPLPMRVANAAVSYTQYIQKMIWPHDLAVLYPYPDVITSGQIIAAIVVLGGITILSVRYVRRIPWLFVGWFWFAGTLVPVIGLVQVGVQRMADRYTYLPLVGLFVIISWGTAQLVAKWRHRKIALSIATAVLCILLVAAARAQVSYWKNSFTLFERTLEVTKGNYVIHTNLGFELALHGRTDEAMRHYRAALRSNPQFELAHINLGTLLFSEGKIEESLAYHRDVLAKNPNYAGVHHNLGILLLQTGETDTAEVHLREALRIKPDYADAYNSLGAALVSMGRIDEAIASFREAVRIKPQLVSARTNLENLTAALEANPNQKIKLDFQ